MRLVSVNVGQPRRVTWHGQQVTTSIFKAPVQGSVMLRRLNLDGDRQADLSVHGGPDKAVYAYPAEHYAFWRKELPGRELPWGMFGENLTTEGLLEAEVRIGDRFRIGAAEVEVSEPRMPCYKLGLKFEDHGMVKRFLASLRTGFYLRVLREGHVVAGEAIEPIGRAAEGVTVLEITKLYAKKTRDRAAIERAIRVPSLPESWREYFRERL